MVVYDAIIGREYEFDSVDDFEEWAYSEFDFDVHPTIDLLIHAICYGFPTDAYECLLQLFIR